MTFTYEEDGITVTMETDATSLYDDYNNSRGVLDHFKRFLAACDYTINSMDELSVIRESETILDRDQYNVNMDELERLREKGQARLPFAVFDHFRKWMADWSVDKSVLDSSELRFEGTTFRPLVDKDAAKTDNREEAKADSTIASASQDGWIEWSGGQCPVDADYYVEVMLKNAETVIERAGDFYWDEKDDEDAIVRYRVVEQGRDCNAGECIPSST